MSGYLRKRGDHWYYRIYIGIIDGKRKQIERFGGKTKKEAEKALRVALNSMDVTGLHYEPSKMSFHDYLNEWLENYVKANLKNSTYETYRSAIEKHIKPSLGKYALRAITSALLQKFIGSKKDEGYKKNSLNTMLVILKKSLNYAVQPCEYIKSNPAIYVTLPKYQEAPKEARAFTSEELKKIFDRFGPETDFYMPIMLAYHTGARLGECLALTWDDIDMDEKIIYIRHTLSDKNGEPVRTIPKSKNSIREIPYIDALGKILKARKVREAANKLKYGQFYITNGVPYVCTRENGALMTSNAMRYFGKYCHGILRLDASFHNLRHTHATRLLENGAKLEYVSRRLGHASISITADVYAHVTNKMHERHLDILNQTLLKP